MHAPLPGNYGALAHHEHAVHTGRQRVQAHYGRATGTYTRSVRCIPPHLGATRGYAFCQKPFTYANARVR